MDFYKKKVKSKPDVSEILNEKEYKLVSLQVSTEEANKTNNKQRVNQNFDEINSHIYELEVIQESAINVEDKKKCENLIRQFKQYKVDNFEKGKPKTSSQVFKKVPQDGVDANAESVHVKQNKVGLNEVEEKLRCMRQKRLNRLSTFVDEQMKLAEKRNEGAQNVEIEKAIKSFQNQKPNKPTFKTIVEEKVIGKHSKNIDNQLKENETARIEDPPILPPKNEDPPILPPKRTIGKLRRLESNENKIEEEFNKKSNKSRAAKVREDKDAREAAALRKALSVFLVTPVFPPKAVMDEWRGSNSENKIKKSEKPIPKSSPTLRTSEVPRSPKPPRTPTQQNMRKLLNKFGGCVVDQNLESSNEDLSEEAHEFKYFQLKSPSNFKTVEKEENSQTLAKTEPHIINVDQSGNNGDKTMSKHLYDEIGEVNEEHDKDYPQPYAILEIKKPNVTSQGKVMLHEQNNTFDYIAVEAKTNEYEVPIDLEKEEKIKNGEGTSKPLVENTLDFKIKNTTIDKKLFWQLFSNKIQNIKDRLENGCDVKQIEEVSEAINATIELISQLQSNLNDLLCEKRKSLTDMDDKEKLKHYEKSLDGIEKDLENFKGLKRDSVYLNLSNKLSNCFLEINKITSMEKEYRMEKFKLLERINDLVGVLEMKVNRNETLLTDILEEQVKFLGTKFLNITAV